MDTQQTRNPLNDIVEYSPNLEQFSTQKHTYYIVHDPKRLPIDRFIEYEKRLTEVAFKADFGFISATVRKALTYLDFSPEGTRNAIATLFNLLQGLVNNTSRELPVLWFCSVFILREDEDIKRYDLNISRQKIQDWTDEGINNGFFFLLATNIAKGLQENVAAYSQIFSQLPMNPAFEQERLKSLDSLKPSIPANESKTKLQDDGSNFST